MKAWHFLLYDGKLGHTNEYPKVGETIKVDPEKLEVCSYGLHACKNRVDALIYAPSKYICRVELSGEILRGVDKVCASERKILWMIDGERVLRQFAIDCALSVVESCSKEIIDYTMLIGFLYNESGFTAINSAAHSAAESAADSAARSAARSAAYSAAYSAARSAAYSAADFGSDSAAYFAAYFASDSATHSAARKLQEEHLLYLLEQEGWNGE
jgi:hypothetical protein